MTKLYRSPAATPGDSDPDPLADRLLAAVARLVAELAATDLFSLPTDRAAAGRIRTAVRDARAGVVRLDLAALLGSAPSSAERRAAHRALDRLAAAGRIQRLVGESRTTHVQLLDAPA